MGIESKPEAARARWTGGRFAWSGSDATTTRWRAFCFWEDMAAPRRDGREERRRTTDARHCQHEHLMWREAEIQGVTSCTRPSTSARKGRMNQSKKVRRKEVDVSLLLRHGLDMVMDIIRYLVRRRRLATIFIIYQAFHLPYKKQELCACILFQQQ